MFRYSLGVIHYYPFNGSEETRPRVVEGAEDTEATTIEMHWEGRQVNEDNRGSRFYDCIRG